MKELLIFSVLFFSQLVTYSLDTSSNNDTLPWISQFKNFRTAVYHRDTAAVKKYFKFPLLIPNNEIWVFTLSEEEASQKNIYSDKIIPFTEYDLSKYFNKIFSTTFIKSILKIKTDVLLKNGYFETIEQFSGDTKYKIYATYAIKSKLLTLNLAYTQTIKDESTGESEKVESNVIYYFIIQKNGRLVFKQLRLAG